MAFFERLFNALMGIPAALANWVSGPDFGFELGVLVFALIVAVALTLLLRVIIGKLLGESLATRYPRLNALLLPVLILFCLGVGVAFVEQYDIYPLAIRAARGVAFIYLLVVFARLFTQGSPAGVLIRWLGIPLAALHVFGVLDDVTGYLDAQRWTIGNIEVSVYALLRTLIFGTVLFWFGRLSSTAGKQAIRSRKNLDIGTREVLAKLFEITLFVVVFLLLLQVMGINLTALAVFGGALGVGLGFGLQQIASNFISGLIILLDRSVTIGDYIELEDGRAGVLRDLTMRYGVLETFDGKDVMVPNEKFITSQYVNWTHKDPKQRYSLELSVAYSTDLDLLFDNIRSICKDHPQVLSDSDLPIAMRPDAEIAGFGDSGIDILVEFWMEGIDDGENRVCADLMHSIWRSIQSHGMQIPYPQREVRILKDD
ncbi:MAG: mechanosensitive ion channel domain-containing protein [Pseudomonadota bacterium]